jgi:GNAT superfamily N-acetyltransferase
MPRYAETRPTRLELALPEDAGALTIIQARSFLDDFRWVSPEEAERQRNLEDPVLGPPGVTSIEWTREMIEDPESVYYKILLGDRLVGGLILAADAAKYSDENFWRIFVEPVYQGRGIGQEAFRQVYRRHPDVARWRLGTPDYATRNHHFYEQVGFTLLEIRDIEGLWFRSYEYENALPQTERLRL